MTLDKYFENKPRGSKIAMARRLGISKTWLSLVISGKAPASPELCVEIERVTKGAVSRRNLRPDVFGVIR
jgi:DNA-binding transcriptional regulator YdaS (Cro superfamily)